MRTTSFIRASLPLLLAVVSLVVLAAPASAAHTAPWRWMRVDSGAVVVPNNETKEVTIACPAGYLPISLEYYNPAVPPLAVQAEYMNYTNNWGHLKVYNPDDRYDAEIEVTLNCVNAVDIGPITTSGVTLGRWGDRSGGWVDCPSGWGPLSFGTEWEGFNADRRVDFSSPTEVGWYATGSNPDPNAHLYLEVHCATNAVLAGAQLVEARVTGTFGTEQVAVVSCPADYGVMNAGAFQHPIGEPADPFAAHGSTLGTNQTHLWPGKYAVWATMPPVFEDHWLVARAWCVPYSTPVLTVSSAPSGEQHVRSISYSFTATEPIDESLTYWCTLDRTTSLPCTPGITNTVADLALGNHGLLITVLNDTGRYDQEAYGFTITTVPDPPTVTDSTPSLGAVSVAFTPGGSGGSPITGFTASCTSTDGGVAKTKSGPSSPLAVVGLTPGKHYHCQVRATNAVGNSAYSDFGPTVLVPGVAPGAPVVTGSTPSAGAVTVAFNPPVNNGGGPISGYTVQCVSTDGGVVGFRTGTASPLQVTNLSAAKHYHCRVRATNAAGTGAYGAYGATVLLPAATVPGTPTVTTSTPSAGGVNVAFTPPVNNGGSPITGYTVQCVSTDGGVTGFKTGTVSPLKVVNLSGGKHYHCRTRATNAAGTGAYGGYGATVLLPAAAAPPAPSVTGSTPSAGAVGVAFTSTGNGGSPITSYTVQCVSTDGGVVGFMTGMASPLKVVNLSGGKHYHCRTRATNAAGTGPYSPYGATVLLPAAAAPPAPSVTGSTPLSGAVSVAFTSTGNGGSPITSYTVQCVSTDGGVTGFKTGTASPLKVVNLSGGKHYHCRTRATNAVGTGPYGPFGATVLVT